MQESHFVVQPMPAPGNLHQHAHQITTEVCVKCLGSKCRIEQQFLHPLLGSLESLGTGGEPV